MNSPATSKQHVSRRKWLEMSALSLGVAAFADTSGPPAARADAAPTTLPSASAASRAADEPFGYCLNTSTIRGANLTIVESIEVAAKAGYQAIEPWVRDIDAYTKQGGSIPELARRIADLGLTVQDVIGFDEWLVDDDARRAKGLEAMKRDMETAAKIGSKRIAAPAMGAQMASAAHIDPRVAAERYRTLLELGDAVGVQPLLELWGHSRNLSRLGEVASIAIEANHPKASLLLDLYHLHRGGSDFSGLRLLNLADLHLIHVNDYPDVPVDKLTDAQRVFPGDGVAPLNEIFRTLATGGFRGYLSLELFNRDYWKQSPLKVAKTGIEKMRQAVRTSLAGAYARPSVKDGLA